MRQILVYLYQLFLSPETGYDLPPQQQLSWSPELEPRHLAYHRQRELATEIDALPTIGLSSCELLASDSTSVHCGVYTLPTCAVSGTPSLVGVGWVAFFIGG